MYWTLLLSILTLSTVHCYGGEQLQIPVAAQLNEPDDDLQAQIRALQKNVSDIWTYIYQLRNAVSNHLTHLRQHQAELENSMHTMEHLHESELRSSGHHSGEQHSHSGEQHSHSGEHSHSGGEHSHSGGEHSHSGEHHSHSGEHGHHSYSHSHSSHDHSKEDHHHHHDHKDSHENEDVQTRDGIGPPAEGVVAPTYMQEHQHHDAASSAVASTHMQEHHYHTSVSAQPPAEAVSAPTVTQEHHHHGHPAEASNYHHQHGTPDTMNLMNEPFHHRHHNHYGSRGRNRSVELPRYADYGQYDLALCRVEPNKALPESQQQDIMGTIAMWQKKTGGPLNFHIRLQGFDVGHGDHHDHQAVQQEQDNEAPVTPVGHRHGFHIHASGDLSNGCQSAGPHYNPKGVNHGSPSGLVRHVGDLGSIECDDQGNTNIMFSDDVASLRGQYSVIGKAIVIHAKEDDLGLGGDAESLRTGNAGARLACCVIQKVDKIPLRQYKAMKSATQFQNR